MTTPHTALKIFDWDRYRSYVAAMTGAEEELIRRHFQQVWDENGWDQLGLSSPEAEDRFQNFQNGVDAGSNIHR